jgi:hypothetical protein
VRAARYRASKVTSESRRNWRETVIPLQRACYGPGVVRCVCEGVPGVRTDAGDDGPPFGDLRRARRVRLTRECVAVAEALGGSSVKKWEPPQRGKTRAAEALFSLRLYFAAGFSCWRLASIEMVTLTSSPRTAPESMTRFQLIP